MLITAIGLLNTLSKRSATISCGRTGIVSWGSHFVEYISNIEASEYFAIACLRLAVSEEGRLIARSSSGACLGLPALFARISASHDGFRLKCASLYI